MKNINKKQRKILNAEKRNEWGINPTTKVVPDKKRQQKKNACRKKVLSY